MPEVITTCAKCGAQYSWNTDFQEMPDCPKCGFNPKRQYQQSDIQGLMRMLKSGDGYTSSNAAAELGKRGDRRAVEALIAALKNDDAKLAAVIALGKMPDERAAEPLISILKEGQGPSDSAAEALVRIGSTRAMQAVAERIEHIEVPSLADVFGAFKSKGKSVVPFLVPMLKSENRYVREYAAVVLKDLGWKPEGQAEQIQFYVGARSWDKLRQFGHTAVDHLHAGLLGDSGGLPRKDIAVALEELGWKPETDAERVALLVAKGEIARLAEAGASAVEPLVAALNDNEYSVRRSAAEALGKIADSRAVEPLIRLLKDKEMGIRMNCAKSLGAIKDSRAVEPLIVVLTDKEEWVRDKVIKALGAIGDSRAVSPLIAMLNTPDRAKRGHVAEALCAIGKPALEPLISALKSTNVRIRRGAAMALGGVGDLSAIGDLVTMLKDRDQEVRWTTAEALGKIGDQQAVEPLIAALEDRAWMVRCDAAEALGHIRDPRAVKPLKTAFKDKEHPVQREAGNALKKITGQYPKVKEGCFIATACYGSAHCAEIVLLKEFRDRCLLEAPLGELCVRLYYRFSPPAANFIRHHPRLKSLVRQLLVAPIVRLVSSLNDRRKS